MGQGRRAIRAGCVPFLFEILLTTFNQSLLVHEVATTWWLFYGGEAPAYSAAGIVAMCASCVAKGESVSLAALPGVTSYSARDSHNWALCIVSADSIRM